MGRLAWGRDGRRSLTAVGAALAAMLVAAAAARGAGIVAGPSATGPPSRRRAGG